jgi:hypothetical protein
MAASGELHVPIHGHFVYGCRCNWGRTINQLEFDMPSLPSPLEKFPSYKHFAPTVRMFGLKCNVESEDSGLIFYHKIRFDSVRLSISPKNGKTKTYVAPRITKIYMDSEFEKRSRIRDFYKNILEVGELHFSWLRIASVFRLSGLAKSDNSLESMICDFAAVTKIAVPDEPLIRFVIKWSGESLPEAATKASERAVKAFYASHPDL